MEYLPDKSIDMILCDLPYGTTACKWDTVIPFEPLWAQYKRLIKPSGAIVLTASQPFTTALIASNMGMFKYCWVWEKTKVTGYLNAKKQPLKTVEDICVFYKKQCIYNPQMEKTKERFVNRTGGYSRSGIGYGEHAPISSSNNGLKYPYNIVKIPSTNNGAHPTQKPVALFEYLIKTYTNEGDIILDNCIGSGTTAIAALQTGRFFIGIEKDEKYCNIARQRIEQAQGLFKEVKTCSQI